MQIFTQNKQKSRELSFWFGAVFEFLRTFLIKRRLRSAECGLSLRISMCARRNMLFVRIFSAINCFSLVDSCQKPTQRRPALTHKSAISSSRCDLRSSVKLTPSKSTSRLYAAFRSLIAFHSQKLT